MAATTPALLERDRTLVAVGLNHVRLLRDGAVAFPAMLAAIAAAQQEVLLEMYWLGGDRVGERFRAALIERARAGVRVRILFDAVGSMDTPGEFWSPLVAAGALVLEFSPISPLKRQFRAARLAYRDHRKILVVDGKIGFTGGINIGELWAPPDAPELGWRDDDVEIRGPAAGDMRAAFYDVWKQCGGDVPAGVRPMSIVATHDSHVRVLTNRIEGRKNRVIHRTYLFGLRHATTSVDIASAYFLPGPRFLRALRSAAGRGVRVRILIPEHSDQRIVALATSSLYGRLLASGVEVFMYLPRVLHTKTAIFDGRYTMIGSHNLDAVSAQYNLECNVVVDSAEFGAISRASFERDLADSTRLELDTWKRRPVPLRFVAWFAALFRAFM